MSIRAYCMLDTATNGRKPIFKTYPVFITYSRNLFCELIPHKNSSKIPLLYFKNVKCANTILQKMKKKKILVKISCVREGSERFWSGNVLTTSDYQKRLPQVTSGCLIDGWILLLKIWRRKWKRTTWGQTMRVCAPLVWFNPTINRHKRTVCIKLRPWEGIKTWQ